MSKYEMSPLVRQLCETIYNAKSDLLKGKPDHALAELEYAEVIVDDWAKEKPELFLAWMGIPPEAVTK